MVLTVFGRGISVNAAVFIGIRLHLHSSTNSVSS